MYRKNKILLIFLFVVSVGLRFYDLDRGDPISDEVLYGFRSIGYLDFDFAKQQPGVPQLFANREIPFWTKLSFHDHPPLVFLIQHLFMKVGGANLWALRLPSALFGLVNIYLLYLIGRRLFSRRVAVLAAALMSVNVLMVYLGRTAVQEAQLIFFILLSVYLFLRAIDQPKYFIWTGLVFGLALLSKYTVLFLVPVFITYLLIFYRQFFRSRYLYLGAAVSLLLFSPVIIYNILLYKTFGHFDFQWSYFFSRTVSYWQVTPGKEIGTVAHRFLGIFKNLWFYVSPLFVSLAGLGFIWFIKECWRPSDGNRNPKIFLLIWFIFNFILYLGIGPSPRFLTMLIPILILILAEAISFLLDRLYRYHDIFYVILFLFLLSEVFYSLNSYIFYKPKGREPWNYSRIHWDMHPWGFNALDSYLDSLLANKYPHLTVPYSYDFLESIKKEYLSNASTQALTPAKIVLVYDENISELGALWVLNRRALYQAWPIVPVAAWRELQVQPEAEEILSGYSFYFIQAAENTLLVPAEKQSVAAEELAQELKKKDSKYFTIYNHLGQSAFYIYSWQLGDL